MLQGMPCDHKVMTGRWPCGQTLAMLRSGLQKGSGCGCGSRGCSEFRRAGSAEAATPGYLVHGCICAGGVAAGGAEVVAPDCLVHGCICAHAEAVGLACCVTSRTDVLAWRAWLAGIVLDLWCECHCTGCVCIGMPDHLEYKTHCALGSYAGLTCVLLLLHRVETPCKVGCHL
jgi:hypothetical protein